MGVREQIIFPEIDYDAIDEVRGLDVTITTSARSDEEAFELLRMLGMPFRRADGEGQAPAAGAVAPRPEAEDSPDEEAEEPQAEQQEPEEPEAEEPQAEAAAPEGAGPEQDDA
jgi:hypothetical protein